MRHLFLTIVSFISIAAMSQSQVVSDPVINTLNSSTTIGAASIHDPSIVYSPADRMYYIWGSHMGNARSSNLLSWTTMHSSIWYDPYFVNLAHQGDAEGTACNVRTAFNTQQVTQVKNYAGELVSMSNFNAETYANRYATQPYFDHDGIYHNDKEYYVDGCMWAPDIIWNGNMQKWCMYLSLNGDNWSSIIILLTSSSAEGPWTYQGPVVMGGFNGTSYNVLRGSTEVVDSAVVTPNFRETDLSIALGVNSIPSRYNVGTSWGSYWPNCIDPCAFFDEDGELWLAYGSWSGGIFILKLDKETGLNDYQYNYENNPSDYSSKGRNGVSDPYFGRKIAGGYYVSGEGPYIKHIGDYYYLFMSYGGFAPREGYDMRIFRSTKPNGPYTDAAGRSAVYTGYALNHNTTGNTMADTRGTKILGAYTGWGEMQTQGWNSQGHNSAVVNPTTNQAFVVYHTKFNDGTNGHLVHIQQLFQNESGWLVASPFAYNGETETLESVKTSHYTTDDLVGDWHFIRHHYKMRQDSTTIANQKPVMIHLSEDGTVSGAYTGTWSTTAGTDYITLTIGGYTYKGVICSSSMNGDASGHTWTGNNHKTISFTCMDSSTNSENSGTPVWGYRLEPRSAIAINYPTLHLPSAASNLTSNLNVYSQTTENVKLSWSSNNLDILSNTGKFSAPEDGVAASVTFTGKLTCGDYYWTKDFSWQNRGSRKKINTGQANGDYLTGLVAYYDFDQEPAVNRMDETQTATLDRSHRSGTVPTFETDSAYRIGNVLHQYFGAQVRCSYARMDNPLKGQSNLEGATISLWVKRLDSNVWDALWSVFDGTSSSDSGARLYLTGNSYLGYNSNSGTWFDINHPNDVTSSNIPVGEWTLVTYVFTDSGVTLYINGIAKAAETFASSAASAEDFDYSLVLDWLTSANYFYLGMGSFWGSAPAVFDDLLIYNRALTQDDITGLNTMENRNYDFSSGQYTPTGISFLEGSETDNSNGLYDAEIYDLNGRRLNGAPQKGIYIKGGKKKIAL